MIVRQGWLQEMGVQLAKDPLTGKHGTTWAGEIRWAGDNDLIYDKGIRAGNMPDLPTSSQFSRTTTLAALDSRPRVQP
jgi:hypothetical protein